jgi:hypothetical protein
VYNNSNYKMINKMLMNLLVILVVICLIYQLLNFLNNKENYYYASESITNMEGMNEAIGFGDNGYMIQDITTQKYLTHKIDDRDTPLKFDMSIVKSIEINGQNYNVSQFFFYPTTDNKFIMKASGPIDPRVGDTFLSTTSQYGLKNSKPNIESKVKAEAGGTGFVSVFEIENDTETSQIFKINKQRYIIKPYVPDVINKINEYNLQKSIERQKSAQIRCGEEATKLVSTTYNKTIDECARDCDSYDRCSHFQYYYGQDTNNKTGRCELFKKCNQEKSLDAVDSIIYKKSDKSAVDKAERDRENRMLGIKNKNYGYVTSLIGQNTSLANEIKEMLLNIKKKNPQFASPESNSAAVHVNRHQEIVDLIDDPGRLDNFRLKINQNIQDYKLCDLEKEMADLEKLKADVKRVNDETSFKNKEIKGVKCFDNSQILNVYSGKETNDGVNNHLIFGNGKCLAFNQYRDSKTNQDLNQYDFIHCNVQNNQQQFSIRPIETLDDYNSTVKSGIDRLTTSTFVDMDFNVINPKGKEQECLTLNEDGLTIEPCTLESNQRFSTLDTVTAC